MHAGWLGSLRSMVRIAMESETAIEITIHARCTTTSRRRVPEADRRELASMSTSTGKTHV
jgi:hypothetical protein